MRGKGFEPSNLTDWSLNPAPLTGLGNPLLLELPDKFVKMFLFKRLSNLY